ncbi:MAG: MFS transporter [Clostridia bacterium]|nr:MFS transporter [Clostridia bacterium]
MQSALLTALCGTIDFVPHWILLGVYAVIILLVVLFIAFKGIKRGVKFIILGLILMAGGYLAYLGWQIGQWEVLEIIDFAISWGPTIIFTLILMTATFVNAKRGLRKSLIFALHAVCAGALSLAFFFIMVNVKEVDTGILNFANLFFGGEGGLQRTLGVSEDLTTMKEVLAHALPVIVGENTDLGILLASNTAYLYTIVDLAYRLIFAVLSLLIYFPLIFILYLIYHLCYSQRKYKKRRIADFQNGKTDKNYRKHHVGGGAVGLVRGLAVGLLSMSFLGGTFYIVAGGTGDGKLKDYDFKNDDYNTYYTIYRSFESYGAQGIFSVLNILKDKADTPYYLFAMDLIFSGELTDEEAGISENIKFREEFGTFVGFARDTVDLLMKYGEDELREVILGQTDDAPGKIIEVMSRSGFQQEFDALIDAFDEKTYIINLAGSLVNTIVNNIDDLSFTASLGEDEREIAKVLFKKGYLSKSIPDERALLNGARTTALSEERPYLNVSRLVDKKDIKIALGIALSIISEDNADEDGKALVKRIVPEIAKLSLLSDERRDEVSPVLGRLYCLCENMYLTVEGQDGITYEEIKNENVDWVEQILTLMDLTDDVIDLYDSVYADGKDPVKILTDIFDDKHPDYNANTARYDNICTAVTESQLLGKVLASSLMYDTLFSAITNAVNDVAYLPKNIHYSNYYNEKGEKVYGETYQLLYGVKFIAGPDRKEILDTLLNLDTEGDIDVILDTISKFVEPDDDGNKLSVYLTDSYILRSIISVGLIKAEKEGNTFYVPEASKELDEAGEHTVPLINKEELVELIDNMDELARFVRAFGEGGDWEDSVDRMLEKGGTFDTLVRRNRIFEGTVAQTLNQMLEDNLLVIPNSLQGNIDGWVTSSDGKKVGELIRLLDALMVSEFPVSEILRKNDGEFSGKAVLDKIMELSGNEENLKTYFKSTVLHYTVSDYILNSTADLGNIKIIVPLTSRQKEKGETLELVRKTELISLIKALNSLGLGEEEGENTISISTILIRLAKDKSLLKESIILPASIVATLIKNEGEGGVLDIPARLIQAGSESELMYYDDDNNIWQAELINLIDALDEIFSLRSQTEGEFVLEDEMESALSNLLSSLNEYSENPELSHLTRLRICYNSEIILNKMTKELDKSFKDSALVPENVLDTAKDDGYYTYKELQSLSDALDIFGINDILEIDKNELEGKVKDQILHFNDPLEAYGGKSTLNVVYPSVIISYMISSNLDEAVKGNIYEDILTTIKGGQKVYEEKEIENLVDVFGALEIEDFDDISAFDFGDLSKFENNLDTIYNSDIAKGIITKSIHDAMREVGEDGKNKSILRDHPNAYMKELPVYKKCEIECLLKIYDNAEADKFNFDEELAKFVYDEDDLDEPTKSYLLVASASEYFINSQSIIVPEETVETIVNKLYPENAVEGNIYIRPEHLYPVVKAFCVLSESGNFDEENLESWATEPFKLPDTDTQELIFNSIIMRARITKQLIENTDGTDTLYVIGSKEINSYHSVNRDFSKTYDWPIISYEEIKGLTGALELINEKSGGDGTNVQFIVPDLDGATIMSTYTQSDLDKLYQSDIIKFRLSDAVISYIDSLPFEFSLDTETVDALDLKTFNIKPKEYIPRDKFPAN